MLKIRLLTRILTGIVCLVMACGCELQSAKIPESPLPVTMRGAQPIAIVAASVPASQPQPAMIAHCINVGQADATLLEFRCGAILVDAGSQDDATVEHLLAYLERFFTRRTDLNRTLESVIITHNHIDHTRALREIVQRFNVRRYIDNGQTTGRGTEDPRWVRQNAHTGGRSIVIKEIAESQIRALPSKTGLTDDDIDPVACSECDPKIKILSGRYDDEEPGWSEEEFDNKNNHSLCIRVDFGASSILFTGDMEESALETMRVYYTGTQMLDVDVWHVGHHGSHNGTTTEFLDAMTLKAAVISMGKWDYGKGGRDHFTTWYYGHPRRQTVTRLSEKVSKDRNTPATVMVADKAQSFNTYTVRKAIYGTGWDGTVKVFANWSGDLRVTRNN